MNRFRLNKKRTIQLQGLATKGRLRMIIIIIILLKR